MAICGRAVGHWNQDLAADIEETSRTFGASAQACPAAEFLLVGASLSD